MILYLPGLANLVINEKVMMNWGIASLKMKLFLLQYPVQVNKERCAFIRGEPLIIGGGGVSGRDFDLTL